MAAGPKGLPPLLFGGVGFPQGLKPRLMAKMMYGLKPVPFIQRE